MYAFNDNKFTNNKSERSNCWDGLDVKVLIVIRKENKEYKKKNLKTPRGEQPETEEWQATQRPNEKGQKDEQRTTKHHT